NRMEKYRKDADFQYYKYSENQKDIYDAYRSKLFQILKGIFGNKAAANLLSNIHYFILLIAVLLVALYVGRLSTEGVFQKSNAVHHGKGVQITSTNNSVNQDLKSQMEEAMKNADFKLALRLQFISLLRSLHQNKIIQWESYKTNYDYYFEIKDAGIKQIFREIAYVYEHVWYGGRSVSQDMVNETEQKLKRVL
ncbi:MAG: hypothetical protein JXR34_03385, partial [Bacteroidales bacterium]|nr:hypothetical protein [Bacteroidales bacterium]